MRLLVVDDDVEVRELVARALQRDGHLVTAVATIDAARAALEQEKFDVSVLDLALPDGNGIALCRELRKPRHDIQVLMLTAHSEVSTRVDSLDAGADFLGKPFAVAELRARVRALGRRRASGSQLPSIVRDSLHVDFGARRASQHGASLELTPREWIVLEILALRPGRVVARAHLLEEGWGHAGEAAAASLEVIVGRIRRKLGDGALIRTVRGEGYILETT
jgi:two-component system OmpR family response regulator